MPARRLNPRSAPVTTDQILVTVDTYTKAAAGLRDDLTELERCVFSPERADATDQVYFLKREVLEFRDAIQPLVPVLEGFTGVRAPWPEDLLPYLRDVADHLRRTDTDIRSLDDLLDPALDAHLARVGPGRTTTCARSPPGRPSSPSPPWWLACTGMNFEHMPELGWSFGYPLALGVMAAAAAMLYRAIRHNGRL
ncbi:CorA family divalent cation transporter [Streptomyces sp. CA-252508]|uniref:CorA family divalent cation transporter n=1 Tax=Streptomyces sp. CA-252508 TaxID=3418946 RepID=UPI003D90F60A